MKKSLLLILFAAVLTIICLSAKAQSKKPVIAKADTSAKPKYNYFVVLPAQDYGQIISALAEYKSLQMYNPNIAPEQKVKAFQSIEAYLNELPKRIKIDSVKFVSVKK